MNSSNIIIHSESELAAIASEVANSLPWGEALALNGELGAGKTTFVRYLIAALGCSDHVSSPTFALCNEYNLAAAAGSPPKVVEHWDLYRLQSPPDELLESLENSNVVRIIEWHDKFAQILPSPKLELRFELVSELESVGQRKITVNGLN